MVLNALIFYRGLEFLSGLLYILRCCSDEMSYSLANSEIASSNGLASSNLPMLCLLSLSLGVKERMSSIVFFIKSVLFFITPLELISLFESANSAFITSPKFLFLF